MKKLITIIMLTLVTSTVSAEGEIENGLTEKEQRMRAGWQAAINALLLNYPNINGPISVENPPWAPASCACNLNGEIRFYWCDLQEPPEGCVAQ